MLRLDKSDPSDFTSPVPAFSVLTRPIRDPRIQRSLEVLRRNPRLQVIEIASGFNLSASRFRHLFKKELGISPTRYSRLTQLEKARELLENTLLEVKEIAALVGLNDVSHFVRSYKSLYGKTPSETRTLSCRVLRRGRRTAITANE